MQVVNQPLFVGEKDHVGLVEILFPVVSGWNKKKMAGSQRRPQGNPSGTAFPEVWAVVNVFREAHFLI